METDKLTNHSNVNSSKKLRYTPVHKETVDGYGFSNERISGAVHLQTKKHETFNSFGNSDSRNSIAADATEMTKLRPRGAGNAISSYSTETSSHQAANVVYLERDILPNDTLQSFALLYGCTVSNVLFWFLPLWNHKVLYPILNLALVLHLSQVHFYYCTNKTGNVVIFPIPEHVVFHFKIGDAFYPFEHKNLESFFSNKCLIFCNAGYAFGAFYGTMQ